MPLIRGSPRSGAFLRSSVQLEQVGFFGSLGRGNSLAITPSYRPPCSTNRNQPTAFPVSSSVFCHRPATDGSAAAAALTAARSATSPAITNLVICAANGPLLLQSWEEQNGASMPE